MAVAVMVSLINLEQVLAYLVTSPLQLTIALGVFIAVLRLFPAGRRSGAIAVSPFDAAAGRGVSLPPASNVRGR